MNVSSTSSKVEKADLVAVGQTVLKRLFGLCNIRPIVRFASFDVAHRSLDVLFHTVFGLALFLTGRASFSLLGAGTGESVALSSLSLEISPSSSSVSDRFKGRLDPLSSELCASCLAGEPGDLFSLFTSSFFAVPSTAVLENSGKKSKHH